MNPISIQLRFRIASAVGACVVSLAALLAACGGSAAPDDDVDDSPTLATAQAFTPTPIPTPTPAPSPRIVFPPTDATVGIGAGVQFSVYAVGNAGLSYQWYKNGVAMPGKTAASIAFTSAAAADQARYRVRVRDGFGSTLTTADATLTVVSGAWARLGGRSIYSAPFMKQPALALCAQPTIAHLMQSGSRTTLYAHYFDGINWRHFGAGGILNATSSGSASDPSIDCVNDGTTYRPVVAWSEGDSNSRNIYVKYFDGANWVSVGSGPLNVTAGSNALKPSLRVTPLDASTGNTLFQGLTLRSAVAWIENGVPSVRQWSMSGWQALPGGAQIPGGANAKDIALTIELDEIGRTYPPVVAWLQESNGTHQAFSATHNLGLGTWVSMGAPISDTQGALPPALPKGRIGIGVGKYLNGRQPLAVWADANEPGRFLSHMYPTEFFVNGVPNQAWTVYGSSFAAGGTIESSSFDPREFRRQGNTACFNGDLMTFGLAIAHSNGFEVRRGTCGSGNVFNNVPADWEIVRTSHNVVLKEIALRMAGKDDPWVAGTQLINNSYQLSIWKYYP